MRSFQALCMKELRCFFLTPIAYLVMFFFLLLMGCSMWYMMLMLSADAVEGTLTQTLFGGSIFFWVAMIISVPVITMRLLADEKKSGTIESLLTVPVKDYQIVLAKYLAAVLFFITIWLPTAAYPLILIRLDPELAFDWPSLLSSYAGTLLVGAMFLSIGLLASAISRNQVVAAIITLCAISVAFFAGFIPFIVPNPAIRHTATYFSPVMHMMDFSRGLMDSRPFVLYCTTTAFFLFATVRVVESGKWK